MAEASLRYVIVQGEAHFSRTEYICGRNSRSEYRNGPFVVGGDPKRPETMQLEFGPRRALIQNRDLGYRDYGRYWRVVVPDDRGTSRGRPCPAPGRSPARTPDEPL